MKNQKRWVRSNEIQETPPFSPCVMDIQIQVQIPFLVMMLFTKMTKEKMKFPMIFCAIYFYSLVSVWRAGSSRPPANEFAFCLSTLASNIFYASVQVCKYHSNFLVLKPILTYTACTNNMLVSLKMLQNCLLMLYCASIKIYYDMSLRGHNKSQTSSKITTLSGL